MSSRLPATVYLLMSLQALSMCIAPLYFLTGGLVGNDIAPRPGLATLPIAMVITGTAVSVVGVTRLMAHVGRRLVFALGSLLGCLSGVLAAGALVMGHFGLFCTAGLTAGVSIAAAQQYRFAAVETVSPMLAGKAASRVLLAGLVAAYLGPELVVWGGFVPGLQQLAPAFASHQPFVGAFLLLSCINLLAMAIVLAGYRNRRADAAEEAEEARPLVDILRQRPIWLAIIASAMGYAMMSFMMTGTPLNMHAVNGHSLLDTKWVIQSHIVAMYAPAFISGWLITRLGHRTVIALGGAAYLACLAVALAGQHLMHYWWAMVLLGIGWNFMFVGGTALLPLCHRPSERFKVQSANEFAVFGSQAVAALSAGWVVNLHGWDAMVALSFLSVLAVSLVLWINRPGRPRSTAAVAG
ncbi:MAG: MFS transporter [Chromatocurvus sp.]